MTSTEDQRQELRDRVRWDVEYHAPTAAAVSRHERLRRETLSLAETFIELCPPGRELSLALTKLVDEALAHANAAVARHHDQLSPIVGLNHPVPEVAIADDDQYNAIPVVTQSTTQLNDL